MPHYKRGRKEKIAGARKIFPTRITKNLQKKLTLDVIGRHNLAQFRMLDAGTGGGL